MAIMAPANVLRNFKIWLSIFAGAMITALYTGSSVGYVSNNSVLAQRSDQTSRLIEVKNSPEMETSQYPTTYKWNTETSNDETSTLPTSCVSLNVLWLILKFVTFAVSKTAKRHDKILCWIVTHPGNLFKAKVVRETWGRKCDKLIFISSKNGNYLIQLFNTVLM